MVPRMGCRDQPASPECRRGRFEDSCLRSLGDSEYRVPPVQSQAFRIGDGLVMSDAQVDCLIFRKSPNERNAQPPAPSFQMPEGSTQFDTTRCCEDQRRKLTLGAWRECLLLLAVGPKSYCAHGRDMTGLEQVFKLAIDG